MKSDVQPRKCLKIARNMCGKKRKKGVCIVAYVLNYEERERGMERERRRERECERGNTKGTKKSVGWSMVVGPWVESLASIISIMTVAEVIQQK